MLIVSWNVAGLKPALQKIHSDYGSSSSSVAAASSASSTKSKSDKGASAKNKKKDSIDPFANYIRLHGDVDILCLQEHKIPLTQLSSRSEPHRCSSIEGYVLCSHKLCNFVIGSYTDVLISIILYLQV